MPASGHTESLRGRAARGVRWNGASMLSSILLQIAVTAALARMLHPSEFGLMGLVLVATGFAQALSDFGLGGAIIYRQTTDQGELSSLFWANTLGGAGVFLLCAAGAPLAASLYGEPALATLLPAAALAFLVAPLGQPMTAMLQRDLRFRRLFFCEIAGGVGGAAVSLYLAWKLGNAFALAWGQLAAVSLRTAALWTFAGWRPSMRLRMADLRPHLSFGLYQTGQRLVNVLVQNLDKLLIGRLLGTTALGYYAVAYQLMVRPMLLVNPIVTRVAFPVFASMGGDVRRVREGYLEMLRALAFVMMPLYLAMFALSGPLIRVLLGDAWMPVEPVFRILVVLGLVQCMGNPLDSLLLALGRARLAFWFNILALALYAAAIPIGARYGLQGVAYALLIACVGALVPADIWLRWSVARMTPGEYAKAWTPFLAMAAVMAAPLAWAATRLSHWHPAAALAALSACGGAVYLAMTALWRRAFLERMIRMTTGGG